MVRISGCMATFNRDIYGVKILTRLINMYSKYVAICF